MAFNLCTQFSIRPEVTEIFGRFAGTGVNIAPVAGPGYTIAHTANSGVYVVSFIQTFAEYLGVSGSVIASGALSATLNPVLSFAWSPALRQLTITATNITTSAAPATFAPATDAQITEIDFDAAFSDSRVA